MLSSLHMRRWCQVRVPWAASCRCRRGKERRRKESLNTTKLRHFTTLKRKNTRSLIGKLWRDIFEDIILLAGLNYSDGNVKCLVYLKINMVSKSFIYQNFCYSYILNSFLLLLQIFNIFLIILTVISWNVFVMWSHGNNRSKSRFLFPVFFFNNKRFPITVGNHCHNRKLWVDIKPI